MSEPLKKPAHAPESYDPKDVPEIVKMAAEQNLRPQETLIEAFDVNGIKAEVVDWQETIWCGKLAHGRKNNSEPNVEKLLHSYLKLDNPALTKSPTEPEWSVCMSLNYLSERPRGIMFGMQVDSEQQLKVYDIYKMPPARYMRVLICEETAQALGVEMWHGGIPPYGWIGEHIAPRCGYRYGSNTLPVFEYYGFYDPETNGHKFCYLYVPVEKVDVPESYDPQDMPEIVKLAAQGQAEQTKLYAVKTANGGSYIDGAPMLGWGKWQDNTYCGCIAAVMEVLGAPVSYETLMGVSGLCYRIGIKVDLDPSSEISQNGDVWDDQISAAIGYKMHAIEGERKRGKRARGNLDTGRPVLGMGLFSDPEWEILTGYDETAFFGRSYFHTQTPLSRRPLPEMPGEYLRAVNYPGVYPEGFMRFFDKPCDKGDPLALLKKSLEICLAYWNHPPRADNRFGEAAYRLLIEKLAISDEAWKADCGCMPYHIGCLADARRSAYVYLKEAAVLLPDAKRLKLLEIAGAYQSIADDILAVTPYEMLNVAWASCENGAEAWSGEIRHDLVVALEKAIETEKQIQATVKDLLERWEEPESYDPKDMPEIVKLAAEQGNTVARPIADAVPQPEIITKAFQFVGFEAAIDLSEAHWKGMDEVKAAMQASLDAIAGKMQPLRFVGMWQADPKANYKKKNHHTKRLFFFGVEVSSLDDVSENCVTRDLPESTYAVFKGCDHGAPKYEWLAAAGYEQDGEFQTKYVLDMEQFDDIDLIDSDGLVDWYVPVKPASYDPKAMPEILKLAAQGQAESQATSEATSSAGGSGGGKMIPNVPDVKYDGNETDYIINILQALFLVADNKTDRAEIAAFSTLGNIFAWTVGKWSWGNECLHVLDLYPRETEIRLLKNIGWTAKYIDVKRDANGNMLNTDAGQIRRDFVESIDKGYPVIMGNRYVLTIGYEGNGARIINKEARDGEQGEEAKIANEINVHENWEDTIENYIILKHRSEPAPERERALGLFKHISERARRKAAPEDSIHIGFAGWEAFINLIEHDDFAGLPLLSEDAPPVVDNEATSVEQRFGIYCDGLCKIHSYSEPAAYYRALAKRIPEWRKELVRAAKALEACAKTAGFAWKQGFGFSPEGFEKFRDPEARKKLADKARQAMQKDMEAVFCFEAILRKEGMM